MCARRYVFASSLPVDEGRHSPGPIGSAYRERGIGAHIIPCHDAAGLGIDQEVVPSCIRSRD
jgi:hypothetical protein